MASWPRFIVVCSVLLVGCSADSTSATNAEPTRRAAPYPCRPPKPQLLRHSRARPIRSLLQRRQHRQQRQLHGYRQGRDPCETVYDQFEIDDWVEFDRIWRVDG